MYEVQLRMQEIVAPCLTLLLWPQLELMEYYYLTDNFLITVSQVFTGIS